MENVLDQFISRRYLGSCNICCERKYIPKGSGINKYTLQISYVMLHLKVYYKNDKINFIIFFLMISINNDFLEDILLFSCCLFWTQKGFRFENLNTQKSFRFENLNNNIFHLDSLFFQFLSRRFHFNTEILTFISLIFIFLEFYLLWPLLLYMFVYKGQA